MKKYIAQNIKYIRNLLLLTAIVITLFTLSLTLVWCIPNRLTYNHMQESLAVINQEGREWAYTFTYALGCRLDNVTDGTMLEAAYDYDDLPSPLLQALSVNGYSRYWHGYLVFLRPLMVFLNYTQLRYLYMLLYLFLFAIIMIKISQRLGTRTALCFTFSLSLIYYTILAYSLQFSGVYFIMLAVSIFLLYRYQGGWPCRKTGYLFLLAGMLTNFLDLLTAPLLTLGIPLIFIFLINIREDSLQAGKKNWKILGLASITWGFGYATSWISKWMIATVFLKKNVILDALNQILFRTQGSSQAPVDRAYILLGNIYALLPPGLLEIPMIHYLLLTAAVLILIPLIRKRRNLCRIKIYLPVILLCLYPYLWYMLLANHSQVHLLFTYRTQMITVFGIASVYMSLITDRDRPCA